MLLFVSLSFLIWLHTNMYRTFCSIISDLSNNWTWCDLCTYNFACILSLAKYDTVNVTHKMWNIPCLQVLRLIACKCAWQRMLLIKCEIYHVDKCLVHLHINMLWKCECVWLNTHDWMCMTEYIGLNVCDWIHRTKCVTEYIGLNVWLNTKD